MRDPAEPSAAPSDPSWWFSEAIRAERGAAPSSPLRGRIETDVAIVGGGFTGLWTALAIKERAPTTSVVLIEAGLCGSGASGKNGGKCHGYWSSLGSIAASLGGDAALEIARAGTRAQDAIRAFATAPGRDIEWREGGNVRVSTSAAQDEKIATAVDTARRLGVPDTARALSPAEVADICRSPVFRGGIFVPEGVNLQPAKLARALRKAAIEAGVIVHENTPMTGLDAGTPNRVRTADGEVLARDVVLATNTALATRPDVAPYVTVFSSYALMTEVATDRLAAMGWTGEEGFADLRMFLHYFRKTADGRVLLGSGSGPISFRGNALHPAMTTDTASARRAARGLRRLLPDLADTGIAKAWGGAIDVSSDRLPFFRTVPGTRIHFGCGYSGHGVNATYIGGRILSALALGEQDDWTRLPFCTRDLQRLPPEPFRYIGGQIVKWGVLGSEEAEERGLRPGLARRASAAIPRLFGLRIGVR